jgi:hypothetical protein
LASQEGNRTDERLKSRSQLIPPIPFPFPAQSLLFIRCLLKYRVWQIDLLYFKRQLQTNKDTEKIILFVNKYDAILHYSVLDFCAGFYWSMSASHIMASLGQIHIDLDS